MKIKVPKQLGITVDTEKLVLSGLILFFLAQPKSQERAMYNLLLMGTFTSVSHFAQLTTHCPSLTCLNLKISFIAKAFDLIKVNLFNKIDTSFVTVLGAVADLTRKPSSRSQIFKRNCVNHESRQFVNHQFDARVFDENLQGQYKQLC